MTRKGLLLVGTILVTVAISGAAHAYSLLDYQAAVAALKEIDPSIKPPPNDPSKDFAVGGFTGQGTNDDGFANKVALSAHSGPLGEDAKGHVSETEPHFFPPGSSSTRQARFRVTCLAVLGNDAALGLVPTQAASNDEVSQFVLAVRDNGLPNGVGDEYAFVPDVLAEDCVLGLGAASFFVQRGNILVHDALP